MTTQPIAEERDEPNRHKVEVSLLDAIIDSVPNRVCIIDQEGRVVRVNFSWLSHIDVVDSQVKVGDSLLELYRHFRPTLAAIIQDILDHNLTSFTLLSEVDGKFFDTTIRRLIGEDSILISEMNMTDMIMAQRRLEEERGYNERLSMVARHTEKAVLILKDTGEIEWVNDAATDLLGGDLVGTRGIEVAAIALSDPRVFLEVQSRLIEQESFNTDVCLKVRGVDVWHKLEVRNVSFGGSRRVTLIILTNINERVASEYELAHERALLSSVIENVPHCVFWRDETGRYQGCNRSFAELLGREAAEILGRTDDDLSLQEFWKTENAHGELVVERCGVSRSYLSNIVQLTSEGQDGRLSGTVGILADITEFKQIEKQLFLSSKLESIGQLAAGVAHEINTPMQYIGDNLHFLQKSFQMIMDFLSKLENWKPSHPEDAVELRQWMSNARLEMLAKRTPGALENARAGVDSVSAIVRSMKTYSHPGGENRVENINTILEQVINLSRNEWKYHATLNTDFEEGAFAWCEPGLINQVFVNLIVNSSHAIVGHCKGEPGQIFVRTRVEADRVLVEIEDNGGGIPDEIRNRVFDPFFTTKEVGKGTGQGLAIARKIIEQSGGSIDFVSEVGRGTKFTIKLQRNRN